MSRSHRWKSSNSFDIDAYLLGDSRWMLFAYIKDERLVGNEQNWKKIAAEFTQGEVAMVCGALKTEKRSEPVAPIAIADKTVETETWCREGWLKFRLETAQVLNPGLFLDQLYNRHRLIELIQEAASEGAFDQEDSMLNLFSYTGSFTMAALCAGVKSSTSVDVSARYLGWEKQNFEANFGGLEVEHRLIKDDARDFLRRSVKRGTRYRWIVIDPPTFSRGQQNKWQVRQDLVPMLNDALACLNTERSGAILISTNDSGWEPRAFYSDVESFARKNRLNIERGKTPEDFGPGYPLKSVWLLKP